MFIAPIRALITTIKALSAPIKALVTVPTKSHDPPSVLTLPRYLGLTGFLYRYLMA